MTHVTCRLTAKNRDPLRNPMLGNRIWASFTFLLINWIWDHWTLVFPTHERKQPLENTGIRLWTRLDLTSPVKKEPGLTSEQPDELSARQCATVKFVTRAINYKSNSIHKNQPAEILPAIKRNFCLGGILFNLIEGTGTKCIGTYQARLPAFLLIIVGHLTHTKHHTNSHILCLCQLSELPYSLQTDRRYHNKLTYWLKQPQLHPEGFWR